MTATETARLLMLTESMVRLLARSGKIKAKKDGNAWQFDEADVARWKAERPARKPQDHPWRHGMILGRQNWRCRKCSTLNTRRKACSKCGAEKKEKADVKNADIETDSSDVESRDQQNSLSRLQR